MTATLGGRPSEHIAMDRSSSASMQRASRPVATTVLCADPVLADGANAYLRGRPEVDVDAGPADVLLVFADVVDQPLRESIEAVRAELVAACPGAGPRLVLVVDKMAERHLWWAVGQGLTGALPRSATRWDDVIAALVTAHQGEARLPSTTVGWLLDEVRALDKRLAAVGVNAAGLTACETEILRLFAVGLGTAEVARQLNWHVRRRGGGRVPAPHPGAQPRACGDGAERVRASVTGGPGRAATAGGTAEQPDRPSAVGVGSAVDRRPGDRVERAPRSLRLADRPARRPGRASRGTGHVDLHRLVRHPTTIATAGHCVDPEEGRLAMHMERGGIDPETGLPTPVDYSRPAPIPTVYAFQPRELPGAVLTSPVIVRVHSFRTAEDGDTAKLEVHGMPPGKPLPIASTAPRIGEPVVSIGFPGLNIADTDGVNLEKLMEGGQTPADVLQDSRLHPVNTSGTIMARQFRKGVAVYQVNADFAGGLSGGPTINSRGQVYGINSMMTLTLFGGGNFNVITDTGMLREFLEHDELSQPQPQPEAQPQPEPLAAAAPATPSARIAPANQAGAPPAPPDAGSASDASIGWIVTSSVVGGALLGGLVTSRLRRPHTTPPAGESGRAAPEPAPA